jgi:ribosome-associated toxin RatA of RatAB toxin-antitoxin module
MYVGKIKCIVRAPIHKVYKFLFEIENWHEYLPHCLEAKIQKQDTSTQVVNMKIKTGKKIDAITTVRNFKKNVYIEFCQTTLPTNFKLHEGKWLLTKFGEYTLVTVTHYLKLSGGLLKRKLLEPIIWHYFVKKHSLTTLAMMKRYLEK